MAITKFFPGWMPDKFNTGLLPGWEEEDLSLIDLALSQYSDMGGLLRVCKHASRFPAGTYETVEDGDGFGVIIKNLLIKNGSLYIDRWVDRAEASGGPYDPKWLKIVNCKIDLGTSVQAYCINGVYTTDYNSQAWPYEREIHVEHCEFIGSDSGAISPLAAFKMKWCNVHDFKQDSFASDSPLTTREFLYGWNGGKEIGSHADFIQMAGNLPKYPEIEAYLESKAVPQTIKKRRSYIRNCRCDMLDYIDENGISYLSNGASYNDCDNGDGNIDIHTMWANGGTHLYWFAISKNFYLSGTAKNLLCGCTHLSSPVFVGVKEGVNAPASNITVVPEARDADKILVGSVWLEDGKIKISVTNYTNAARSFTIRTNLGSTSKSIAKCLTDSEIKAVNAENGIAWDSFPFDKIYEIDANGVTDVEVLDGSTVVRKVSIADGDVPKNGYDGSESGTSNASFFSNFLAPGTGGSQQPTDPDNPTDTEPDTMNDKYIISKYLLDNISASIRTARGAASSTKYTLAEMADEIPEISSGGTGGGTQTSTVCYSKDLTLGESTDELSATFDSLPSSWILIAALPLSGQDSTSNTTNRTFSSVYAKNWHTIAISASGTISYTSGVPTSDVTGVSGNTVKFTAYRPASPWLAGEYRIIVVGGV